MFTNLSLSMLLVSATVIIHSYGLIFVTHTMSWIVGKSRLSGRRSRIMAMNIIVIGTFAVLTVEVWLWGAAYYLLGILPDFEAALYFSTTTFSTVGFGDMYLEKDWRLLSAIESVDGFLLIGWSTAYLISAGMRVGPFRQGEHF